MCVFWRLFCGEVGGTTLPRREVGGVSMALCPPLTEDRGSSGEMGFVYAMTISGRPAYGNLVGRLPLGANAK